MKHVVVVEDDASNAALFRKLLERRGGHQVSITEDPAELLAWVEGGGVDLVLMDVSLSHSRHEGRSVNGVELCRLLKSRPATARVPVVLATAHAMRGDSERLMAESGADDYVSKPVVDHVAFVAQLGRHLAETA